jgi:2-(1,2-epoxy-1,2-dihydrophenyl)acetyl-CoA isomerase
VPQGNFPPGTTLRGQAVARAAPGRFPAVLAIRMEAVTAGLQSRHNDERIPRSAIPGTSVNQQNILYQAEGAVATITLNRPQALNAVTFASMDELRQALDRAEADAAIGAVVLTGAGRAFCAGADLAEASDNPPRDAQGEIDLGEPLQRCYEPAVLRLRSLTKPVVAAVNGIAAGVGCSLALLADLTVAARSASFVQAFVNIGLVPDGGGTWLLPQATTPQRAMGMALLGEKISAEQALQWGLIWQVVDDEQLAAAAQGIAARLAAGPRLAVAGIKRSIHAARTQDLAASLLLERELQRACGRSEDFVEGVSAFLEKRKASFKGR